MLKLTMKFLSLFLFLFLNTFFAFNNGPISEEVMKKAERKYSGSVVSRYLEYNKMLAKAQHSNLQSKLQIVNNFFNKITYQSDIETWKQDDYWATPLEFLARNKGDSEDFVIAKYFALKTLEVDTKKLYFAYVNATEFKHPHMVLSYFETPSSDPLILDNIKPEVLNASLRVDLTPVYNFNANTLTKLSKSHQNTHKKWEKLIKRVKRNKL